MKLLLFGSFWRGSRELSYQEAFKKLGWEVEIFDSYKFLPNSTGKSFGFLGKVFNRLSYFWGVRRLNKALVKKAIEMNPELILIIKGREVSPWALKKIKKWNTGLIFNFNTDDFFPPRHKSNSSRRLRKSIPHYHCIFTYKPYALCKELSLAGAQRVEYNPMAFDPDIHKPAELSREEKEKYSADVVFVGSPEQERIAIFEKLAELGVDLKIYGPDWHRWDVSPTLKKCLVNKPVYADEMAKVYAGAKIVLCFMRRGDRDLTNSRMFEVPACGGFMMIERNREVARFFEEGKEIECFGAGDELAEKVKYYLSHEDEIEKIVEAGHRRVISSGNDFDARVKKINEVFEEMWLTESIK
jgi:spore maturation protein CgeB